MNMTEAIQILRSILSIKSKRKKPFDPRRQSSEDEPYHNDSADLAIWRELVENDITTQERLKDYEAYLRRKKMEEESR